MGHRFTQISATINLPADFANSLPPEFEGEVRTDPYSRMLYSTDASIYQIEPLAVALPCNADDVQMVVELCAREKIPVLARGAGSSLSGQAVGRAVVLDFSRHLNQLLEVNREEHWARLQPGIVSDVLNAQLRAQGLMFGTDPASANRATLGGMLANNSTGAHSMLYGMTADHIIETDVVLADGSTTSFLPQAHGAPHRSGNTHADALYSETAGILERYQDAIVESYPRTWRNSSGYRLNYLVPPHGYVATQPAGWDSAQPYPAGRGFNLAQLLAGSEGTLAVVTEMKVNLVPLPPRTALAILQFESIAAASYATPAILETKPSAVELLDSMIIRLTREVPAYDRMLDFVDGIPAATLIVEYYGADEAELNAKLDRLDARMKSVSASAAPYAQSRAVTAAQQANVWGVRKVGLGLMMAIRGDAKPIPFIEDAAVPVELLGDYVTEVERLFEQHGVTAGYYAHASAGCLHIRPLINTKSKVEIETMHAVSVGVLEIIRRMGGAMTGEHGDGLARSCFNEALFGADVYQAFRELKTTFDPHGILNPGKVVDAADMRESLRYGENYTALQLQTILSFEREGGFARAIEQCNGAGVCRKDGGVMCPSFQATREEEHSTRGRANALRAALSGLLPQRAFSEARMHAVLDLCLECKACKAECPSAVDMAKIKAEFQAQYHAANGVSLNARLFGNIDRIAALASPVAPLVNLALDLPAVRWLNEKLLGVSRQRRLPRYQRKTFRRLVDKRISDAHEQRKAQRVVLFVDTFTNYHHPEIGLAALKVFDALGVDVTIAPQQVCCGRPMISKGLLTRARSQAEKNVTALLPFAAAGIPIVGLEPACLLTLRDEYLDLVPDHEAAQQVADNSFLIDEYLATRSELPALNLAADGDVLVHGHCYQKALVGMEPTLATLRQWGGAVSEIPSGCCGMAGSWGYEAEHYSLSEKIGASRLFPAVRSASPETTIVAAGTSCRDQIEHFTGVRPLHPVEYLAANIAETNAHRH